ncbi:hypothetical protein DFQ04_2987 [Algoriphagus boseongensis]|uniref:Uncharacterized protein n=1 Tax=Algoriphagus boseongensis TaxID=1442587 RepID=A0A4R6T3M1_9BACT|nr:hypothetical protein [Algoriphagus boseongensis]TDQ15101.1 hypothetical protein DFQ04_2987 [Algoriphagus boseongensis]
MNYNQKLEEFLGISLEDYPSTAYSLIEARARRYSRFPEFFSYRYLDEPIFGMFTKIEVVTLEYVNNRHMKLIDEDFNVSKLDVVKKLIDGLVDIYGADDNRNLWLSEDEEEEIILNQWKGRSWDFPKNEEIRAITISLEENNFRLCIHEMGNLIDF